MIIERAAITLILLTLVACGTEERDPQTACDQAVDEYLYSKKIVMEHAVGKDPKDIDAKLLLKDGGIDRIGFCVYEENRIYHTIKTPDGTQCGAVVIEFDEFVTSVRVIRESETIKLLGESVLNEPE